MPVSSSKAAEGDEPVVTSLRSRPPPKAITLI